MTELSIELTRTQNEFPQFRIWSETVGDRPRRFVARRRSPDINPHTVITGDLDELRATLTNATAPRVTAQ